MEEEPERPKAVTVIGWIIIVRLRSSQVRHAFEQMGVIGFAGLSLDQAALDDEHKAEELDRAKRTAAAGVASAVALARAAT